MQPTCPRCASDDVVSLSSIGICTECGVASTHQVAIDLPTVGSSLLVGLLLVAALRRWMRRTPAVTPAVGRA